MRLGEESKSPIPVSIGGGGRNGSSSEHSLDPENWWLEHDDNNNDNDDNNDDDDIFWEKGTHRSVTDPTAALVMQVREEERSGTFGMGQKRDDRLRLRLVFDPMATRHSLDAAAAAAVVADDAAADAVPDLTRSSADGLDESESSTTWQQQQQDEEEEENAVLAEVSSSLGDEFSTALGCRKSLGHCEERLALAVEQGCGRCLTLMELFNTALAKLRDDDNPNAGMLSHCNFKNAASDLLSQQRKASMINNNNNNNGLTSKPATTTPQALSVTQKMALAASRHAASTAAVVRSTPLPMRDAAEMNWVGTAGPSRDDIRTISSLACAVTMMIMGMAALIMVATATATAGATVIISVDASKGVLLELPGWPQNQSMQQGEANSLYSPSKSSSGGTRLVNSDESLSSSTRIASDWLDPSQCPKHFLK